MQLVSTKAGMVERVLEWEGAEPWPGLVVARLRLWQHGSLRRAPNRVGRAL